MTAIFKGFDITETGVISKKDMMAIGTALNWGQWSEAQNTKLHAEMDENHDGLVQLSEFLDFYRPVITIISDEQFEEGLEDFEAAVVRCCEKAGITCMPPRFAHDDDFIYHTGDSFYSGESPPAYRGPSIGQSGEGDQASTQQEGFGVWFAKAEGEKTADKVSTEKDDDFDMIDGDEL